jgi:hypothetical protein
VWAITSYFNPVGYRRRLSNYKIFRANLAAPLVTVELSFDGRFDLADGDADILIRLSGGALLWQKERLLNLALKAVPPGVDRIAWLDCDVILKRPDWASEAKRQLAEFNVVQLFSDVVDVDPDGHENLSPRINGHASLPGVASLPNARELLSLGRQEKQALKVRFNPGLAWAAKRTLLEDHGFYDAAIVGGGDSLMVSAMYGQTEALAERFVLGPARRRHFQKWAVPFHRSVAGRIGHVSGTACHLRHGEPENRAYYGRQDRLAEFDFDPDADIAIGANGAWHWARPRPDLEDFLRRYFIGRAEDG